MFCSIRETHGVTNKTSCVCTRKKSPTMEESQEYEELQARQIVFFSPMMLCAIS